MEVGALLEPRPLGVADRELTGNDLALAVLLAAPDGGAPVAAVLDHGVVVQLKHRAILRVALGLLREGHDTLERRETGLLRRFAQSYQLEDRVRADDADVSFAPTGRARRADFVVHVEAGA